jgi:hypothetical protein
MFLLLYYMLPPSNTFKFSKINHPENLVHDCLNQHGRWILSISHCLNFKSLSLVITNNRYSFDGLCLIQTILNTEPFGVS